MQGNFNFTIACVITNILKIMHFVELFIQIDFQFLNITHFIYILILRKLKIWFMYDN
jgi:hypothetical protein